MDLVNFVYSSENINSKKFKLTLTKAQKLMTKLKSHIDKNKSIELGENLYFYTVNKSSVPIHNENKEILDLIDNKNKQLLERNNNFNILNLDYVKLKAQVHQKNAQCKLDETLSYIEYLNQLKKTYETYLISIDAGGEVIRKINESDIDYIRSKSELGDGYYNNVNFRSTCFEREKLKELIKEINKKLDELENSRDFLNATSEIEVEFNEVTVEFLGL